MKTSAVPARTILATLLFSIAALAGGAALAETLPQRIEIEESTAGRSVQQTRKTALKKAKKKAVTEYVENSVPPAVLEGHAAEFKNVLGARDQLVVSWEVLSEKVENDILKLELLVTLDAERIETMLRKEGLKPPRALPRTFVAIIGSDHQGPLKSGWDRAEGAPGRLNDCEDRIGVEFERYGFELLRPAPSSPKVDVEMVVKPRDQAEKKEVFRTVRRDFNAGALVVGLLEVKELDPDSMAGKIEVTVKVAAGDAETGEVVFTDNIVETYNVKSVPDRAEALRDACGLAGEKAVPALFDEFTPKYLPGEERTIEVTVRGLDSYERMRAFEKKTGEEAPGLKSISLDRMAAGEVVFKISATSAAGDLARWFETNRFDGAELVAIEISENGLVLDASISGHDAMPDRTSHPPEDTPDTPEPDTPESAATPGDAEAPGTAETPEAESPPAPDSAGPAGNP